MYKIYLADPVIGVGQAVIVICSAIYGSSRFAEYHVLIPKSGERISLRLRSTAPFPGQGLDVLTEEMLASEALKYATDAYLNYLDERYLESKGTMPLPRPVSMTDAGDTAVQSLWYRRLCAEALPKLADSTGCADLKGFLQQVVRLPQIADEPIP